MEESADQQGLLEKPVELQLLHTEYPKQFLGVILPNDYEHRAVKNQGSHHLGTHYHVLVGFRAT